MDTCLSYLVINSAYTEYMIIILLRHWLKVCVCVYPRGLGLIIKQWCGPEFAHDSLPTDVH